MAWHHSRCYPFRGVDVWELPGYRKLKPADQAVLRETAVAIVTGAPPPLDLESQESEESESEESEYGSG